MKRISNGSIALSLVATAAGMLMLAYASVPLYRLFCQATGLGGIARQAEAGSHAVLARSITVQFDANVSPELAWSFRPLQKEVTVRLGEEKHIVYEAKNEGSVTTTGTATFNISPVKAGIYFNKLQCFCFSEQKLKPGESKRLDVTFFIDPALNDTHDLDDIHTITLSYTFFPLKK